MIQSLRGPSSTAQSAPHPHTLVNNQPAPLRLRDLCVSLSRPTPPARPRTSNPTLPKKPHQVAVFSIDFQTKTCILLSTHQASYPDPLMNNKRKHRQPPNCHTGEYTTRKTKATLLPRLIRILI